jgi:hypothetical protein
MRVLVVVPNDQLRHEIRDLLAQVMGPGRSLRATDYRVGLLLAEQHYVYSAILWSPPGLDSDVIHAVMRLRRMNRDIRIIVASPEVTPVGAMGYIDDLDVDHYLFDRAEPLVKAATGVPTIVEGGRKTIITTRGTSRPLQ